MWNKIRIETESLGITSYIGKLSELLLATAVTDRQGQAFALEEGAQRALEMVLEVRSACRKIMLVGNGGSAAIVSHLQNDLCKAVGVRAMVFNEPPLLTALSNDDGYQHAFERPVELWAEPGDLMLAVSSSGKSENILRAVQASIVRGCQVITFSGFNAENTLRRLGNVNFYVPSGTYGYVELAHSVLTHFLPDCVMLTVTREKKVS